MQPSFSQKEKVNKKEKKKQRKHKLRSLESTSDMLQSPRTSLILKTKEAG